MKRFLKIIILISAILSLFIINNACASDIMDYNITANLLNSENKKNICKIIKNNHSGNETMIHLAISKTNQKPLIILYKSDGTKKLFSIEENYHEIADSEYEVIVIESITSKDDIADSVDFMIGTYNGFFILRTQAEDQLGRLVHFYYGNFDKSNIAYEAIAIDVYGDIYFISDDVVKSIESIDLY